MQFARRGEFAILSAANFVARYHNYLIGLVISSFLAGFMSEEALGWVISGASAVAALSLVAMPTAFDRSGTKRVLVILALLEISVIFGLTLAEDAMTAAFLFALQGICAYNMFLGLDILLQAHTTDGRKIGHARGIFLVLANAAILAASFSVSFILTDHNYRDVFLIAAAAVVPFTLLAMSLPSISRVPGTHASFKHTFREIVRRVSVLPTMSAHFLLLMFFAWNIYYLPLYLYQHIGFSWRDVGIIFGISILPYLIIEYPVGLIADDFLGEKEMAFLGYLIMIAGTALFSFIPSASFPWWVGAVILASVGGAMVEASTETHFFKHVTVTDTDMIGSFRMLRPLAAIIAPIIASLALLFVPFQYLFLIFAAVLCAGLLFVLSMTDTQ